MAESNIYATVNILEPNQELLLLRIRNAIAGREFNTAKANLETKTCGGWVGNHWSIDAEYDAIIRDMIAKVEKTIAERATP